MSASIKSLPSAAALTKAAEKAAPLLEQQRLQEQQDKISGLLQSYLQYLINVYHDKVELARKHKHSFLVLDTVKRPVPQHRRNGDYDPAQIYWPASEGVPKITLINGKLINIKDEDGNIIDKRLDRSCFPDNRGIIELLVQHFANKKLFIATQELGATTVIHIIWDLIGYNSFLAMKRDSAGSRPFKMPVIANPQVKLAALPPPSNNISLDEYQQIKKQNMEKFLAKFA